MWLFISLELNCTYCPPQTPTQSQSLKTHTHPPFQNIKKLKRNFSSNQEQHLQQILMEKKLPLLVAKMFLIPKAKTCSKRQQSQTASLTEGHTCRNYNQVINACHHYF